MSARSQLRAGVSRVLTESGVRLVSEVGQAGVVLQDPAGVTQLVPWGELPWVREVEAGEVAAVHEALLPRWRALDDAAREQALDRLEVVLTVTTGYRRGFAALAGPEEPLAVFDPSGSSLTARCEAMARQLTMVREGDRSRVRRVEAGELRGGGEVGTTTVLGWVRDYREQGVWGLVDKRSVRTQKDVFASVPEVFRRLVDAEVDRFTGEVSEVSNEEVLRRVKVAAQVQGLELDFPQRAGRRYVAWRKKSKGHGTRAHRTRFLRDSAGYQHYVALRPGQVVAIDVTRSDVMVWDDARRRAHSVEVITAIDVATRVILALRVVPMSANGVDAAMIMYDVMRPFAVLVEGTTVSDWRWCGIPEAVDMTCDHARHPAEPTGQQCDAPGQELDAPGAEAVPDGGAGVLDGGAGVLDGGAGLQGWHRVPGVLPDMVRCDHGSIFVGGFFTTLLTEMGIDLILSRGRRPTDNAFLERLHESYQAIWQRLPGYKGRNTFERGRRIGTGRVDGGRPLLTARELERALRSWVALEYHRTPHDGLVLPDAPSVRLTPLEMWDALVAMTGRIDVPQSPDLIYQFLPVRWATIRQDGVELSGLTYDDPVLDEYRDAAPGTFGRGDAKAPFFRDPRDITRVWWRHPDTGTVHEIPWRGAWKVHAPLTDKVLDLVRPRLATRRASTARAREEIRDQVIRELTELHTTGTPVADQAFWTAAALRVDAARRDHLEALLAAYSRDRAAGAPDPIPETLRTITPTAPAPAPPPPPPTEVEDPWAPDPDAQARVIDFATRWARLRPEPTPPPGDDALTDEKAW